MDDAIQMIRPLPKRASGKPAASMKLAYGVGSVAFGIKDGGFTTLLLLFYSQVLGLSASRVGFAIMVALIVDAFIDPLIGRMSDGTHSRLGRRHPYMYAAALPCGITYYLLWNPPSGMSQPWLFVYLLVLAIAVRISVAFYEIPSASLAADLSTDYDQRTSLVAYRFFFGWLGAIGMGVAAFAVFLSPHQGGIMNPAGYGRYALAASIVMVCVILLSCIGTQRVIPMMARPPARRPADLRRDFSEARAALSNPSFLAMLGAGLLTALMTGVAAALNLYLATYFWRLDTTQVSELVLCSLVGATLALVLSPPIARIFEKRTAAISISLLAMVMAPLPIVLRLLGFFPPNGSPSLMPLLFTINSLASTLSVMAAIIGTSMTIDTIEDNELRTGQRTEGLYFAAAFFTQKFVSGSGVFVAGLLLSIVHFPPGASAGSVDPAILHKLVLLYVPTIVGLSAAAIWCLSRYRINRAGHLRNLEKLRLVRLARSFDGAAV